MSIRNGFNINNNPLQAKLLSTVPHLGEYATEQGVVLTDTSTADLAHLEIDLMAQQAIARLNKSMDDFALEHFDVDLNATDRFSPLEMGDPSSLAPSF